VWRMRGLRCRVCVPGTRDVIACPPSHGNGPHRGGADVVELRGGVSPHASTGGQSQRGETRGGDPGVRRGRRRRWSRCTRPWASDARWSSRAPTPGGGTSWPALAYPRRTVARPMRAIPRHGPLSLHRGPTPPHVSRGVCLAGCGNRGDDRTTTPSPHVALGCVVSIAGPIHRILEGCVRDGRAP